MKTTLSWLMFLCICCQAGEDSDRVAIESLMQRLNDTHVTDTRSLAPLFTPDADDREMSELSDLMRRMQKAADGPWSEVTAPRIASKRIRPIAPGIALVDCTISQYGTVLARHTELMLVMKRSSGAWRIAAVRILAVR